MLGRSLTTGLIFALLLGTLAAAPAEAAVKARKPSGETLYKELAKVARAGGAAAQLLDRLRAQGQAVDWSKQSKTSFSGHLRRLEVKGAKGDRRHVWLIRHTNGELYVLTTPKKGEDAGPYASLDKLLGNKLSFEVRMQRVTLDGTQYTLVKLQAKPKRKLLDHLFFIAIVLLLFLTMVGMGLTLTFGDFAVVFKKPLGMGIGILCQFGLLPVIAYGLGRALGFYDAYPFIFLGMILIAASPGGVTSNLMTYLGKGDVALSIALTATCTMLALLATPLLLTLYVANIPDFSIPFMAVFKQILILVIVPLFVGMGIRSKWEGFAKRAEKTFAIIGICSLLFLVVVGILGNLEKFGDTDRYGLKFYACVFLLTLAGMVVSGLLAKVLRIRNFQIRAIALECGLRNASLAMTIALLLQDRIGDFYSSMFFTSGIFGLWMYAAGALSIWAFKFWLPVDPEEATPSAPEAAEA